MIPSLVRSFLCAYLRHISHIYYTFAVIATNNLFLAKGNIVLRSVKRNSVSDLIISNNRWWSEHKYSNATIVVDGVFKTAIDVVIDSNVADGKWGKTGTRATRTITVAPNASRATIDFTQDLLFIDLPPEYVTCSVWSNRPVAYSVVPHSSAQSWGEGEFHDNANTKERKFLRNSHMYA